MSRSTFPALAVVALASGCVVTPVTTESFDPDCRVATHHMELKSVEAFKLGSCRDTGCQIDVLVAAGVVAVSVVVSGTIVLVGNVVYWNEHRVSCPPPIAAQEVSAPA